MNGRLNFISTSKNTNNEIQEIPKNIFSIKSSISNESRVFNWI